MNKVSLLHANNFGALDIKRLGNTNHNKAYNDKIFSKDKRRLLGDSIYSMGMDIAIIAVAIIAAKAGKKLNEMDKFSIACKENNSAGTFSKSNKGQHDTSKHQNEAHESKSVIYNDHLDINPDKFVSATNHFDEFSDHNPYNAPENLMPEESQGYVTDDFIFDLSDNVGSIDEDSTLIDSNGGGDNRDSDLDTAE